MKLLPYIPSFVKDAAKAVKRITQTEFTKVADKSLTELLGIATLFVTMYALRREGDEDALHLKCAHREEVALCTHCGTLSTNVHQEEPRCVRHLDVWGKKTFLHFLSRRFKCDQCGKSTRFLPRKCPSWIPIAGSPRLLRCMSINLALGTEIK